MKDIGLLRRLNRKGSIVKKGDGSIYLGDGVNLGMRSGDDITIEKLYLSSRDRAGHFGCFGTTRIGKTRLLANMVRQDILYGHNIVIIDPKGDSDLLSYVIQAAVEAGRLDEFLFISSIYPDLSVKIDPLSYYYMPDELVDHTISGIRSREEYFINVASEITTAIVQGMIALALSRGEKPRINFYEIKKRSSKDELKKFGHTLLNLLNHPDDEVRMRASEACENIAHIVKSPQDFFAKVSSSLRTTLTALTSSTTGKIIGKAHTNEFVKRFEEGKRAILFCNTGNLLARRTAHIVGRVLLSMIQSTVGRFFASGRKIEPPLCLYIDEGHNVLYKGIQELFNKGGGAGVYCHFFTQSIAQIEEWVGSEVCQSMVDNINTWVFMKVNHEKTARFVQESTPLRKAQQPILSLAGGNMSVSLREIEESTVLKEKVMGLTERWFYMRKGGTIYKGIVAELAEPDIRVRFPEIKSV